MGLFGRYVASQKGRSKSEGFWIGFLFSIIGVLIVSLLPNQQRDAIKENSFQDTYYEKVDRKKDISTSMLLIILLLFLMLMFIGLPKLTEFINN